MKKLITICAVILVVSGVANANSINFDASAYRPANDGSGEFGIATEYTTGDGMFASTPKAGQKTLYGTEYFNGWAISDIGNFQYTCKHVEGVSRPYTNAVITDGSGHYGVISSQGGSQLWSSVVGQIEVEGVTKNVIEERYSFDFADNSGNQTDGFRFYEPNPDNWTSQPTWWGHGKNIGWSEISSWSLLGVGESRPFSAGENTAGYARGPVNYGLSLIWGDSANNYLGDMDIYDVTIYADGQEYTATAVPVPGAFLLGSIGVSFVGWMKRRRSL